MKARDPKEYTAMKERITKVVDKSRVVWESLEAWVRERIQGYVQDLLEEEVTVLLGREKSERCQEIDARGGLSQWPWQAPQAEPELRDGRAPAAAGTGIGGAL